MSITVLVLATKGYQSPKLKYYLPSWQVSGYLGVLASSWVWEGCFGLLTGAYISRGHVGGICMLLFSLHGVSFKVSHWWWIPTDYSRDKKTARVHAVCLCINLLVNFKCSFWRRFCLLCIKYIPQNVIINFYLLIQSDICCKMCLKKQIWDVVLVNGKGFSNRKWIKLVHLTLWPLLRKSFKMWLLLINRQPIISK